MGKKQKGKGSIAGGLLDEVRLSVYGVVLSGDLYLLIVDVTVCKVTAVILHGVVCPDVPGVWFRVSGFGCRRVVCGSGGCDKNRTIAAVDG